MWSRIRFVGRWTILLTVMVGATQLPATAQTYDPHPAAPGTTNALIGRPAPAAAADTTHAQPPVYEMAAQRQQTKWSSLSNAGH